VVISQKHKRSLTAEFYAMLIIASKHVDLLVQRKRDRQITYVVLTLL